MGASPALDYSGIVQSTIDNLITSSVVIPEQFYGKSNNGLKGGERRLMVALLSDGVQAYVESVTNRAYGKTVNMDAVDWVESFDPSYVFSFDVVCECLGIDPLYLRRGLQKLADEISHGVLTTGVSSVEWKKVRRPRKRL